MSVESMEYRSMGSDVAARNTPLTSSYTLLFAWLVLFAANFMLHDSRGLGTGADSFKYLTPALNWINGDGWSYLGKPELVFPPGYGLRTLPLYMAGVELIQAAVITNIIFLAIACLFIYLICRFYVSKISALLAILFVVTNPYIMGNTAVAMSEVTFMATIAGAGYFVLKFIRHPKQHPLNLAVAGAFAGFALLIRPEGLLVALALLTFLLINVIIRRPRPRHQPRFIARLGFYALIFLVPFLAIYSPYVVYLSKNLGHFAWNNKSEIVLVEGDARVLGKFDTLQRDLYVQRVQADGYRSTFGNDLRRLRVNVTRYASYSIQENVAPLAALFLVAVIGLWRNGFRSFKAALCNSSDILEPLAFCFFMLSPILPMSFYLSEPRMFIPYNPFVIIAAIVLMDRITAGFQGAPRPVDARVYIIAVALPLLLYGTYSNVAIARKKLPEFELQRASKALASLTEERPVNVMAPRRAEIASYYANDRRVLRDASFIEVPPNLTYDGVAAAMREEGLQYLILDRTYIRTRPGLSALWTCDPNACPGGVQFVAEDPRHYRIFKVVTEGPAATSQDPSSPPES